MIGLLNGYLFDPGKPAYQQAYGEMTLNYLGKIMPLQEFRSYHVALGEMPSSPTECDGWIISGSAKSVYEDDQWILNVCDFIRQCHQQQTKMLGFCFGHQLIAHALGGKVTLAEQGWGVGVRHFTLTETFPWCEDPQPGRKVALLYSHRDQVVELPFGAESLATDHFCPFTLYRIDDHILSLQGHPEFTKEFASARYQARQGMIPPIIFQRGIESLAEDTDELLVGEWFSRFFW
jgi:GMP synthase-like glutamine amidotransferase